MPWIKNVKKRFVHLWFVVSSFFVWSKSISIRFLVLYLPASHNLAIMVWNYLSNNLLAMYLLLFLSSRRSVVKQLATWDRWLCTLEQLKRSLQIVDLFVELFNVSYRLGQLSLPMGTIPFLAIHVILTAIAYLVVFVCLGVKYK